MAGGIGAISATMLTLDKISLLQAEVNGENAGLGCDVNAFVSCSSVIQSEQAQVFGFPSPVMGMLAFAILATLGVVLASGVRLPRWMWGGLQIGVLFGIGFVTWLQYESIFQIGRLCPWCLVVWTVTIPIFVIVTRRVTGWRFLRDWAGLIIALWYIAVLATIWFTFGSTLWA